MGQGPPLDAVRSDLLPEDSLARATAQVLLPPLDQDRRVDRGPGRQSQRFSGAGVKITGPGGAPSVQTTFFPVPRSRLVPAPCVSKSLRGPSARRTSLTSRKSILHRCALVGAALGIGMRQDVVASATKIDGSPGRRLASRASILKPVTARAISITSRTEVPRPPATFRAMVSPPSRRCWSVRTCARAR